MLSNLDLENLANDVYEVDLNEVTSKDALPFQLEKGWYIANMQNQDEGNGSHWVCFLYDGLESVYFDSYGVDPPMDILSRVAHNNRPNEILLPQEVQNAIHIINKKQIQALLGDDNCGLYCIGIICFFSQFNNVENSKKLKMFQNIFSRDTRLNQYILKNFLKDFYQKKFPKKCQEKKIK